MTQTIFDSGKESLARLLDEAEEGKLQLPDFQRGWVWDDYGIRALLASISQAFPVGAIMTLRTGGEVRFQPRAIEGVTLGYPDRQPERLLLDGQQRITSLYQATRLNRAIDTQNAQKRAIKRWYYIDMEKALDPMTDREDAIVGLPEDKTIRTNFGREVVLDLSTREQEYRERMFPVNRLFDDNDWELGFEDFWHAELKHDPESARRERLFYRRFQDEIITVFRAYYVPVITLERETTKEAVCLVFEKVNTGGKKLDAFELLTAIYAADNFQLRRDWLGDDKTGEVGRAARLGRHEVLSQLQSTDFLQAISLLHTLEVREAAAAAGKEGKDLPQVSCTRQAILNLPLTAYQKWADAVENSFLQAAKFLQLQRIYWRKDVPYLTQLVALAAIITRLGKRWEEDGARRKIARWYWCGVFGELYGSTIESRLAKDVQDVPIWIDDDSKRPSTFQDANFAQERLYTLRSRLAAAYKGLHALLMRTGCEDFRSGQPYELTSFWEERVDIHHIFPRAWCKKQRIERGRYDCVVNKTPISARANRIIGGAAPSEYLHKLEKNAKIDPERMSAILASHLVDVDTLRNDNFESFFAQREEALMKLIEQATGKPVARTTTLDEPTGDVNVEEEELDADDDELVREVDIS
ncbi:hypothetical protein Thiowin_02427 [Thiorhodovibrio winogradskyi]|uniref:GmrSD restriction endonucleases N-terminal domain-containing protein n=1 Tax=Thiorhodovibrio winogradskyi TaxID=77007 RepID=A0ABZ0S9V6_9GAMM|nr:DUF262 domain-containing protein [Thiorhodovibrio winogradskyi]